MTNLPQRTTEYIGAVTDARIWDGFELRADDIILSTPPKCGTTWSQAILVMLLNGKAESDRQVWKDSLWLDCGIRDQLEMKDRLERQTTRRCIKSHTPLDGLPFHPDVTYLTVYRHPIDVHFSLEKHVGNMNSDILDFHFPDKPGAAFERFLTAPVTEMGTDDLTLSSFSHHYQSFRKWAHLPNIHFFHYSDLTKDIHAQIARYAAVLGINASPELIEDIASASSFASMKKIAGQTAPPPGQNAFSDPTKFFDSATSNKWEGRLCDDEYAAYEKRFSELASPDEIAWLESGDSMN